jgi:hypothetical protein
MAHSHSLTNRTLTTAESALGLLLAIAVPAALVNANLFTQMAAALLQ